MKILHLADTPLSGAPYRLMSVQRQGGLDARLISHRSSYDGVSAVTFPHDILLQSGRSNRDKRHRGDYDPLEIQSLFDTADILHFHNYFDDQRIFRLFPGFLKRLKGKKLIIQVHSPRISIRNIEKVLRDKRIHERLVVAQFQARQFPMCTPVPNAIPIYEELHTPTPHINKHAHVVYSPSNTVMKGWNNKGYKETLRALNKVSTRYTFDCITGVPFEKCMERKRKGDIAIDEIITGSYHLCSLEAMSQGMVPIANMDEACERVLLDYTGTSDHPIVIANATNLTATLNHLIIDYKETREKGRLARKFMEEYWSPERVTKIFREIYER